MLNERTNRVQNGYLSWPRNDTPRAATGIAPDAALIDPRANCIVEEAAHRREIIANDIARHFRQRDSRQFSLK